MCSKKKLNSEFHSQMHDFDLEPHIYIPLRPSLKSLSSYISKASTILSISMNQIIRCYLKILNTCKTLLNYCTYVFCSVPVFFLFWNCNRVDLRGTVTIFCVALSWIILFYLKNTGVNFLLSYCIIFFVLLGVFCFASFVWNWFTSISKEKGPFSVILSDELFFVTSRIQA